MNKPEIARLGDALQFNWLDLGIEVSLDNFYDSSGTITAETTVYSRIPGKSGLLHSARVNLMSTQTRASLARALEKRLQGPDWTGLLEQLCFLGVQQYREGEPPIDLRDVEPWEQTRWLLWPYVEAGGPTVLFAEGGSGKSVLALWMALRVAMGSPDGRGNPMPAQNVLYLDYETSREIHSERMRAIGMGMGVDPEALPPIYYRNMRASLPQAAPAIRRDLDKLGIGLVIIDSLGAAGAGAPEESGTAIPLFQTIRTFSVPSLCVHHKRKSSGMKGENQRDRLFGSVYYLNFARLAWEMEMVSEESADVITVGLVNVKSNNGRLQKRHALELRFVNEDDKLTQIDIRKMEMTDVPELAEKIPLKERITAELTNGSMTAQEIADALDANLSSTRVTLSRMKAKGKLVSLPDKQWGLAADVPF